MATDKIMVSELSATDAEPEKVEQWIQEFPTDIQAAFKHWYCNEAWVIGPDDDLSEFRMQPRFCLNKVEDRMRLLAKSSSMTTPVRIVWMLENRENRGLDDFEAEAVFGQWFAVDLLYQNDRRASLSRMIVCGRFREDIAGLSFYMDMPYMAEKAMTSLDILEDAGMPCTVFLGHDTALFMLSESNSLLLSRFKNLIGKGMVSPGLWVPAHRVESALDDMKSEIKPLRILVGESCDIAMVRFVNTADINPPDRLRRAMADAGLVWDASLVATRDLSLLRETVRRGPYLRGGAYVSQAFDIRTPAGFNDPEGVREIVTFPLASGLSASEPGGCLEYVGEQWQKWWSWRCMHDNEKLAILLDFKRMEEYFRHMEDSVTLHQAYHEYRIYNWPVPGPTPRITFINGGTLDNAEGVRAVIKQMKQASEDAGRYWRVVDQTQLLEKAEEEMMQRMAPLESLLKSQITAHEYLQTLPIAEPLRQDIEDFASFVPASLGYTLELGSGSGQLAMHLAPRSIGYVCSDLNPGRSSGFDREKGPYEVAADVHQLPFCDNLFDSVVANNILEHLYNPLKALQEVYRVLKPDGRLYALVPLDAMNSAHELRCHLWKADLESIRNALDMAGLEPLRLETIDLYAMGIMGSFPTCNGLVCKVEAAKPVKHGEC